MNRREFLQQAGAAAGLVAGGMAVGSGGCSDRQPGGSKPGGTVRSSGDHGPVAVVADPGDATVSSAPAQWGVGRVREALGGRGVRVIEARRIEEAPAGATCFVAAGRGSDVAARLAKAANLGGGGGGVPESAESLAVAPLKDGGRDVVLACGGDARGLAYALSEIAETIAYGGDLASIEAAVEQPANRVRGIGRLFCSDVEDKPWYNDRGFWQRYLDMLAAQRFNRFHLALGLGYDFARGVRDSYFYFPYPFFLSMPEYRDVRAAGLPDAERDKNLEMLRYIASACAQRGIDFQLGLWGHQYEFADSPNVNYRIEGLTHQNHGAYCRDALAELLRACPDVAGVTFRIHGESGVAEGSYDFWKTVFDGIVRSGRRIAIEMHAKGSDQQIIDIALATGMPVTLAPKYWAEHMGLPYAQSAIRALELPRADRKDEGFFAKSSGSRSFLRYGYGDLLAEDRRYDVVHRMWPGTQRMLLWGDSVFASAYGRTSSFCGSAGAELFEPLSFKGRMGSGKPGGRQAYADESLKTADDWEKYHYSYVLWGRMLYNPETRPKVWQRVMRHEVGGEAAPAAEAALASAGRILPTVTTAHAQSASYNAWWVELSWNMPIVDPARRHPFGDTPSPKRFGTVSPLDPQMFIGVDHFAEALLKGEPVAKYTPAEVAARLEGLAEAARQQLEAATKAAGSSAGKPAFRRLAVDVAVQSGMGLFFAEKLRAGILWAVYERTGEPAAVVEALRRYRAARQAWADAADRATGGYAADITYGPSYFHRGHWRDRLAMIDADIADMEKRSHDHRPTTTPAIGQEKVPGIIAAISKPPQRPSIEVEHVPPTEFTRGKPVVVSLRLPGAAQRRVTPTIHFRRVNQAEAYVGQEMLPYKAGGADAFMGVIWAEYTDSPFPLQYYFEFREGETGAWVFPGLGADWSKQPYFVIRQARPAAVRA